MADDSKKENPSSVRQLAAILFADIVGYTSMMQADEALAFQNIKR
jgi:class 3 adenylate cyclase